MTYESAKAGNWVAESFAVVGNDLSLLGSSVGYTRFGDALSDGDTVFYSAFDDNNNREAGYATYSSGKLTDRVITATLKAGVYAEGENLPAVDFNGSNRTVAGTFNQVAFEELWGHIFDRENPHEVIAEQVPQNPANGRGDNVQEALDNLSDHVNQNTQDLIDHENNVGNPHDVKADQVDLSPAFVPAGENVQTALEKIYEQFHLKAGNDEQLYLNFADGDETFIQMRRRYREDDGIKPAYDGFWNRPEGWSGDISGLVGELHFFAKEGRVYTFLEDGTMVLIASQYFFEDAPEDGRTWARKDGAWVEVTATIIADEPPAPITGTLWYDTGTTAELYVYDGDNWISMTGAGSGGGVADNIVLDDADATMRNVALAREINTEGDGFWRQIFTTDLVTENNQPMFAGRADDGIRNQKDANWHLLNLIEALTDCVISDITPEDPKEGDLWFDNSEDVMQLFIFHEDSDAYVPVAPPTTLEGRVTTGEATQQAIIEQIQQSLEDQSGLADRIAAGEAEQSTLKNKVNALEGVVGQHRFDYDIANRNPREGKMNGQNEAMEIVRPCDQIKYLAFNETDRDGKPVALDKINAGDVIRFYGLEGQYAEYRILDGSSGFYSVELLSATLDQFNNLPYEAVLFSSFDPAGLATIDYVDAQDSELQTRIDGKIGKSGNQTLEEGEWRIKQPRSSGGTASFIVINDDVMNLYHVAYPQNGEHAANAQYVDDQADTKLDTTGGTLTGDLRLKRDDGVSYWNYIVSEKPTAWDGQDPATQLNHGLIINIGTSNTYKQRLIIKGRNSKDLFEIHDEGDVGAVAEILGTLKAKDFLDENGNSIIGASAAAERPILWKYNPDVSANNLGNGEFNLSSSPTNASADDWSIYFAKRDANGHYWHPHDSGREFTHEVDAMMASIRGRDQNCVHGKMNKWYFNQGTNNYARLRLAYYRSSNALVSGKYYLMIIPGYFPHFTFGVDAQNNGTHS